MSVYYAFEGLDGAGKTTLVENLAEQLRQHSVPAAVFAEPRDYSDLMNSLFERLEVEGYSDADWMIHQLGRIEMYHQKIEPLFARSEPVVILQDRCFLSTMVYQIHDLRLHFDDYKESRRALWYTIVNSVLRSGYVPDVIYYLPISDTLSRVGYSWYPDLNRLYNQAIRYLKSFWGLNVRVLPKDLRTKPAAYQAFIDEFVREHLYYATSNQKSEPSS